MAYKITGPLLFEGGSKPKVSVEFPSDETKPDSLELNLSASFTHEHGKALDCAYLFLKNGHVVSGFTKHTLDDSIEDAQIKMIGKDGEMDTFFPEDIDKLVVTRGDAGTIISMRITTNGHFDPFIEFFRANRTNGFSFEIAPRQAELFDGGERVNMSETKEEPVIQ